MTQQAVWVAASEEEAASVFASVSTLENFIGGRIMPPAARDQHKIWLIQTLFRDFGPENAHRLPDGLRRVLVFPCLFVLFGMTLSSPRHSIAYDRGALS